ncbi:MAG: DUF2828 family protein [Clostridiales bacterium]|nr:DUF2828 family protein [Clostridiales bacterium]
MNFAEAATETAKWTHTENGAVARNTTNNALLDLYGTIGALRSADHARIETLYAEAYAQDPLFATKILFYSRDIRNGLGERKTFRHLIAYAANHHPEAIRPNLDLVGVFGRYDDLYSLIDTKLEDDMWQTMKIQFEEDRKNLADGNAVSLLAKWIKTADASSEATRKLGILTAQKLGYSVYEFKRIVRALRKQIGIVEAFMSAGQWDRIKYSAVPSRAMKIYKDAFLRHDETGFKAYLDSVEKGETTIHSSTLYPYDLVGEYLETDGWHAHLKAEDRVVEAQWKTLPNYVSENTNALIMADTSGSMCVSLGGQPFRTAIGLAIYFAERNTGDYHNLFMTFSDYPELVYLKGETLNQKVEQVMQADWGCSTDLKAAFDLVLNIAIKNNVPADEMPKAIAVVSDMEINSSGNKNWTFYDKMAAKFEKKGYSIPSVIFWNVNSRSNVFHVDSSRKGVQLASGQSVTVFIQVLENLKYSPVEAMEHVINSERYDCITIDQN